MAHLTPQEVDALAAAHAAADEPAKQEDLASPLGELPTLAYGAEGEHVTKLVNLLDVLDYNTNSVIKGGVPRLDESVLADIRAALYEAVAAKLEAEATGRDQKAAG